MLYEALCCQNYYAKSLQRQKKTKKGEERSSGLSYRVRVRLLEDVTGIFAISK